VCRSGELIRLPFASVSNSDGGEDEAIECGVAVALTQWTQQAASYVAVNQLVIGATPKISLLETFQQSATGLESDVPKIICARIIRELERTVLPNAAKDMTDNDEPFVGHDRSAFVQAVLQGSELNAAVQHYNCLRQDCNRLLLTLQGVDDPTLTDSDSVYRLTYRAVTFLKEEALELDQQLTRGRRWKKLLEPRCQQLF
jgi:hypothetical protein